jgi:hypothetical protein
LVGIYQVGTRSAAIFAVSNKSLLAEAGGIDLLVAHCKSPATLTVLECSVKALLNLSNNADNQVTICKRALYLLLRLNRHSAASADIKAVTSGLLFNLSRHPSNRTRIYKAELRAKAGSIQGLIDEVSVGSPPRSRPPTSVPRWDLNPEGYSVAANANSPTKAKPFDGKKAKKTKSKKKEEEEDDMSLVVTEYHPGEISEEEEEHLTPRRTFLNKTGGADYYPNRYRCLSDNTDNTDIDCAKHSHPHTHTT